MTTVLLAIGDTSLRDAVRAHLEAAGHAPVLLDRPLAPLTLSRKLAWDAVLLDASDLGRETLVTLSGGKDHLSPVRPEPVEGPWRTPLVDTCALIGLGLEDASLAASIPLPLVERRLLAVLDELTGVPSAEADALTLDTATRLARAHGRQVALTRTEFRLLQVLADRRPKEVPLIELLQSVWGFTEGRGTSELVRAHVRNLRAKLAELGLPDAVRSHRGSGYALVV